MQKNGKIWGNEDKMPFRRYRAKTLSLLWFQQRQTNVAIFYNERPLMHTISTALACMTSDEYVLSSKTNSSPPWIPVGLSLFRFIFISPTLVPQNAGSVEMWWSILWRNKLPKLCLLTRENFFRLRLRNWMFSSFGKSTWYRMVSGKTIGFVRIEALF